MTDKRNWEERSAEFEVSWINQEIDYVVEFEVPKTARERADKRWGMEALPKEAIMSSRTT
jgi:hypothetical protein